MPLIRAGVALLAILWAVVVPMLHGHTSGVALHAHSVADAGTVALAADAVTDETVRAGTSGAEDGEGAGTVLPVALLVWVAVLAACRGSRSVSSDGSAVRGTCAPRRPAARGSPVSRREVVVV